jgi:succinate dehydrogenase / fumarate reductase, cytochrome b subunit
MGRPKPHVARMTQRNMTYSEFVLRRLHSLTGVVPLTFFIIFHFFANSFSTLGREPYNQTVDQLRGLPYLMAVEWGFIFAPFLFHMIYGLWVIFTSQPNPLRERYRRNWAYLLQRITAIIVFVFVLYHVIGLHYMEPATDHTTGKTDFYTYLHYEFQNPFVFWWYIIGTAATAFHLANGLCTFGMTWGITIGRGSQRLLAYAATGIGIVLFAMAVSSMYGFLNYKEAAQPTPQGTVIQAQAPAPAASLPQ